MSLSNFKEKRVAVLGLGITGQAAAKFLLKSGATVLGIDKKSNPELCQELTDAFSFTFISETSFLEKDAYAFDFLVVSPGVPRNHPIYAKSQQMGIEIVGEVELACRMIDPAKHQMIGITGTNGKTTVTLLIEHALKSCGRQVKALGNVGKPLIEECMNLTNDQHATYVIELSSFQLETLHAPVFDAACILNITPDHLDRYESFEEYAQQKWHLINLLKPSAKLICYNKACSPATQNQKILKYGYEDTCDYQIKEEGLQLGNTTLMSWNGLNFKFPSHDLENCVAAYLICSQLGIDSDSFFKAAKTFTKPAHRIEFVRNVNGVAYINDSKGTNIDAVERAVESLSTDIILIAGGVHKGFPYHPWIASFKDKVKAIIAIGDSAQHIKKDLSPYFPVTLCENMEQAITQAKIHAKKGQTVLLSPGCSSYDMYRDYKHRGEEFKRLVWELD